MGSFRRAGRVVTSDRAAGQPGEVTLTASQLLTNPRISQAAIVRLNSVRAILQGGLSGAGILSGGVGASKLAP